MSVFAFLPSYEGDDLAAELTARGLGDLLEPGIQALPTRVTKGPTGKPGVLVTFQPPDDVPREYDAKTQTWLESPPDGELAKGRYWVGYANNRRPTPETLQRRTLIDGEPVLLCDDRAWVVPCSEYAPKRLTLDPHTGLETSVVVERHKLWVDWTNSIYALFVSDGFQAAVQKEHAVRIPGGLRYAALTLSKNYRLNAVVVDLLQLVDEYKAFDVARAATAMSTLERIAEQKKNWES